jgi:hypothetical protein
MDGSSGLIEQIKGWELFQKWKVRDPESKNSSQISSEQIKLKEEE